ncbi:MAG: bifunctional 3-(3-hydroxy-phenyl)propionate/3-hydroxycinnamic acid hydroxylase [Chloroflexota bacterium]
MRDKLFDVAILGYGPVGAALANMLGQYGCKTVVLERETDIFPIPRAVHADAETLRIFQAIGLQETMKPALGTYYKREYLNAKGEIFFETLVRQTTPYGHREDIYFHQPTMEAVLREGVTRFDQIDVRLGYEVSAIDQDEACVTLLARNLATDTEETIQAKYLIGCDGARSTVRKQMDMPLRDLGFDQPWLVVDVYLKEGVTAEAANIPNCHRQYCNPRQPITFVPTAVKGHYRWEFMLLEGQTKAEIEQPEKVRQLLSLVVDPDKVDVVRSVVYTFHALIAKTWRVDRVFLAGDAAHQMPPFAGQGMCSGLRDVHNLSWKLAAVLAGHAPDSWLDTYQEERRPHVTRMTRGTMLLGNLIQTRHPLRAFLRDTLFKTILRIPTIFGRIAKFTLRSPDLKSGLLGHDGSKAAGTFFIQPYVLLETGESVLLDEVMGTGFAVLGLNQDPQSVLNTADFEFGSTISTTFIQVATTPSPDSASDGTIIVTDGEGHLATWFQQYQADFVVVRPDRYVFGAYKMSNIKESAIELL